jgi:hypothetical protein
MFSLINNVKSRTRMHVIAEHLRGYMLIAKADITLDIGTLLKQKQCQISQ